MANLVRIKDKFQLTIPAQLRKQLAVREGDYLEASVVGDSVVFRPSQPASAPRQPGKTILDFLSEPMPAGRSRKAIEARLDADRRAWDEPAWPKQK